MAFVDHSLWKGNKSIHVIVYFELYFQYYPNGVDIIFVSVDQIYLTTLKCSNANYSRLGCFPRPMAKGDLGTELSTAREVKLLNHHRI